MIKVLIVDDEPKLREGLRSLIPWNEKGYEVVDTAANGHEALDKYDVHKPELIIADIRMPGMDGLELIQELRSRGADSHVLILSGYADFEYAKRAISYHIDGYLLKPVDEDEMMSYLDELKDTIVKEQSFSQWKEEEPSRNREATLKELLQPDAANADAAKLRSYAASLGIPEGPCEVVLLKLKRMDTISDEHTSALRETLQDMLSRKGLGIVFQYPPHIGLLLTRPMPGEEGERKLYECLEAIFRQEQLQFSAATGGTVGGVELAYLSLAEACAALQSSFFMPKGALIRQSNEVGGVEGPPEMDYSEAENRLTLMVETGNDFRLEELVASICSHMATKRMDELKLKEHWIRLVGSILARLESSHPELRPFLAAHAAPLGAVYQSDHINDLTEQILSYLRGISDEINRRHRGNDIQKLIDLIHRRYNENLKLETLAELFNYNSAYLGKMFKNTTGEYFNTYLDKLRIGKAKELLEQGMKVYEVAERVGYVTPDYFNMKFRKYVGVSPTSYRKGK
ncbi:response regulator [Paenibacillus sp. SAF-054]|uniref:response regulator n=1 Tax=unclassified Paenibacillus TaxID=185978 RepID=UPI003F822AF2